MFQEKKKIDTVIYFLTQFGDKKQSAGDNRSDERIRENGKLHGLNSISYITELHFYTSIFTKTLNFCQARRSVTVAIISWLYLLDNRRKIKV